MKPGRFDLRLIEESMAKGCMALSVFLVIGSLAGILAIVAIKGFPHLSVQMVTRVPQGGYYLGREGGILNAILGSVYLALGAALLAMAVGLPVALYVNTYAGGRSRIARAVRASMDVLWGIPSIVYGAFGFIVMCAFGLRASLGAAVVTVGLLELPIMVRAMDEVLRLVPRDFQDASCSLGATRLETAFRVVARQAMPGLVTATLMAFGRGIGDTAAVLFTAGFTDRIPTSLGEPAATLPLAIFFQLGTPYPEVQGRAYASAAVLTLVVLAVSLAARWLSGRFGRYVVD